MAKRLHVLAPESSTGTGDFQAFPGLPGVQMPESEFVNLRLQTASPSRGTAQVSESYAQGALCFLPEAPQAEWASEAIVNVRHVVAGIICALLVEGALQRSVVVGRDDQLMAPGATEARERGG